MIQIAPVLVEMKQDATKPDRPATEAETFSILAAVSRLSAFMAKYNDSCDRAIEALDRDSKKATLSAARKIFVKMDSGLITFATQIFNKSLLGQRMDSLNYFLYKTIFYRDAGVASKEMNYAVKERLSPANYSSWKNQQSLLLKQAEIQEDVHLKYIRQHGEKIRANYVGSIAAALTVMADFRQLTEGFEKDGTAFWKNLGLSTAKIFSDTAYTIQSSQELLNLLGKRGLIDILSLMTPTGSSLAARQLASKVALTFLIRSIAVLGSWQVMLIVAVAPEIIALFINNELQDWCEDGIFGKKRKIKEIETLSLEQRNKLISEQEDLLVKALHEKFGLPLPPNSIDAEKENKINALKSELLSTQQVHI